MEIDLCDVCGSPLEDGVCVQDFADDKIKHLQKELDEVHEKNLAFAQEVVRLKGERDEARARLSVAVESAIDAATANTRLRAALEPTAENVDALIQARGWTPNMERRQDVAILLVLIRAKGRDLK